MIGCSKKNRESCPRKWFWWKEKESQVKIQPWVSANRSSNNWALCFRHVYTNLDTLKPHTWYLRQDEFSVVYSVRIHPSKRIHYCDLYPGSIPVYKPGVCRPKEDQDWTRACDVFDFKIIWLQSSSRIHQSLERFRCAGSLVESSRKANSDKKVLGFKLHPDTGGWGLNVGNKHCVISCRLGPQESR